MNDNYPNTRIAADNSDISFVLCFLIFASGIMGLTRILLLILLQNRVGFNLIENNVSLKLIIRYN